MCVHPDTRWPLMHVAQAYFLSLMSTIAAGAPAAGSICQMQDVVKECWAV